MGSLFLDPLVPGSWLAEEVRGIVSDLSSQAGNERDIFGHDDGSPLEIGSYMVWLVQTAAQLAQRLADARNPEYIEKKLQEMQDNDEFSDLEPMEHMRKEFKVLEELSSFIGKASDGTKGSWYQSRNISPESAQPHNYTPFSQQTPTSVIHHQRWQQQPPNLSIIPTTNLTLPSRPLPTQSRNDPGTSDSESSETRTPTSSRQPTPTSPTTDSTILFSSISPPDRLNQMPLSTMNEKPGPDANTHSTDLTVTPTIDYKALERRGKLTEWTCEHGFKCTHGGIDGHGHLKKFYQHSAIRAHRHKHLKPFKCDIVRCSNVDGFARKDQLERHKKNVHKMTLR